MINNKHFKIIVLARGVRWPLINHSREEFVSRMEFFAKAFDELHIVSINGAGSDLPIGDFNQDGISYHGIPSNVLISFYFSKALKKISPDAIFIDVVGYGKNVLLSLIFCNAKIILFVQGFIGIDDSLINNSNPILRYISKVVTIFQTQVLLARVNKILCVSRALEKFLCNKYRVNPRRVVFIPHSMEYVEREINAEDGFVDWLLQSNIKFILQPENRVLFSTGKLSKNKGFDVTIKSFYCAQQKIKNLYLIIAGSGPEFESLKQLGDELGLNRKLFFIGMIPRSFVLKLIKKSDMFLFNSITEGFGKSYVEALALGCPLVCSKNEAIMEVTNNESAIILESRNSEDISNVIVELFQNPNKYIKLKKNGRESVISFIGYKEKDRYELIVKEVKKIFN